MAGAFPMVFLLIPARQRLQLSALPGGSSVILLGCIILLTLSPGPGLLFMYSSWLVRWGGEIWVRP